MYNSYPEWDKSEHMRDVMSSSFMNVGTIAELRNYASIADFSLCERFDPKIIQP